MIEEKNILNHFIFTAVVDEIAIEKLFQISI